jgi:hypothetical protein
LNRDREQGSRYGHEIEDIKELLKFFTSWQALHARRLLNTAAHNLAKQASKAVMDKVWWGFTPECILDIVRAEQNTARI